ncbi:MAG: substrate-binding domain-containing protein [Actinomycetota bacterium]|nr:substrate-binding domain-containing protein [Actinomycetota bacterium]
MTPKKLKFLAVALSLSATAAACGGSSDAAPETGTDGAAGGGDLSGEIVISGSSTVEPISIAVAESFAAENGEANIQVSGPGTGDGFLLFCDGEIDISDASRPIKDEEAQTCADNGIEFVELKVAIDGIAVMTSSENADVECLAFGDLYALVGPESTGFSTWSDANDLAVEAGGNGDLPDAELVISAPGTESGTYDSFLEIVFGDIAEERAQEETTRPDYSSAADDNVIVETISSNPTSFGWGGYAFAVEAGDSVKLISISEEAGGECIQPTAETIASNEYPIARDLFVYVNKAKAAENPALVAFVDLYLAYGLDEAVSEVGYVELADEAKAEAIAAWEGR